MKLQNETEGAHGRWYNDACGTAFGMELLGERWSALVLRELMFGGLRFSDLRANLPGLSAKVLTERLERLEAVGAVRRVETPPPAPARLYELTEWGLAARPVIMELGRWAAQSAAHDPTLPLSPVSFMLSLQTMGNAGRVARWTEPVGFRFPNIAFVARGGEPLLAVERAEPRGCAAVLIAPAAPPLAAHFYGNMPLTDVGVSLEGSAQVAADFAAMFALPPKIGPA